MTNHEHHHWHTESAHRTSEGTVIYQVCPCGIRRITVAGSLHEEVCRVGSPAVTPAGAPA